MSQTPSQCTLCGGTKKAGTTTFTADFDFGVVVVRNVPALVCALCGADWIQDDVAARLETIVSDAKSKRLQVEVTTLASAETLSDLSIHPLPILP